MKTFISIILIIIIIVLGYMAFQRREPVPVVVSSFEECATAGYPIQETSPATCHTSDGKTFTQPRTVETPLPPVVRVRNVNIVAGQAIASPITITGEARGWYFEASFPVSIVDATGKQLAAGPATAQGDWMTADFVPFSATLTFTATTPTGEIILHNDNPSGDPSRDEEVRIPVRFSSVATKPVNLYFYNQSKDKDAAGTIQCSNKGMVAVVKTIPVTNTPIQDVIKMLLTTPENAGEVSPGLSTEFPLSGVTLTGASLNSGTLTLTFADPEHKTNGGSCRVAIMRAQIEATAKQFPEVKTVKFAPIDIFQP